MEGRAFRCPAFLFLTAFSSKLIVIRVKNVIELDNFYNDGFGWICRHCERELKAPDPGEHARFYREGEAEAKQPRLADQARAKWLDPARTMLTCPRCGVTEPAELQ